MALPKLNESLKYEMSIPSNGKVITYRPYLVKEEKILLQAMESQDQKLAMRAMVDTVISCVYEDIKSSDLKTFDVEYMFTQIRAKSVGEKAELTGKCKVEGCEGSGEFEIDLTTIKMDEPSKNKIIQLTDDISIELDYPTYDDFVLSYQDGMSESQFGMIMVESCVKAILSQDERYDTSDVSKAELKDFIESMTTKQFEKVGEFLKTAPSLKTDVEYTCDVCGSNNELTLEGLQDFF